MVLAVKNKLDTVTGGVLDVFQSSDGQSIPFGNNWVHKIEDGLMRASVMFVFVTPNSIASNWIYFEAGFAYSKGIDVIPVGLDMDVSVLKAPLNLLQGFNVSSGDGLNNFISVINKKYDYHFPSNFTDEDYVNILGQQSKSVSSVDLKDIFESIDFHLYAEYNSTNGNKILHDISFFFDSIKAFLDDKNISHSYEISKSLDYTTKEQKITKKTILVSGLKIVYHIGKRQDDKNSVQQHELDQISFTISPYNFETSFSLFINIVQLLNDKSTIYLAFSLKPSYEYLTLDKDLAAVLSASPEEYGLAAERIGRFAYKPNDFSFGIYDNSGFNPYSKKKDPPNHILSVSFTPPTNYNDIKCFVNSLLVKGIINKV